MTRPTLSSRFVNYSILARCALGLVLIGLVPPVCLDDDIRIFYARWWFDHPSFAPSMHWLPGHSYFYGLVVGLFDDGLLMPRVFTVLLHLGLGALVFALRDIEQGARRAAVVWIFLSPLSLVLGTVPLAETLYLLMLFGGIVALTYYLESGRLAHLFCAALLYLVAATVRFEGWVMLPVFAFFAVLCRPAAFHRSYAVALALLPMVVPITWTVWLGALHGDPFLYLHNIETDHLGAGDLRAALAAPASWLSAIQTLTVAGVVLLALIRLVRRQILLRSLVFEAHAGAALALLAWAVFSGNVPSQYPLRLLYPAIVLAAVPFAGWFARRARPLGGIPPWAFLAVILGVSALAYALTIEPGYDKSSKQAADQLTQIYRQGHLTPDDHLLIDYYLPDAQRLYIYLNRFDTVHINDMGSMCPVDLIACVPGKKPAWAEKVRAVAAWKKNREHLRWLFSRGWTVVGESESWLIFYDNGQALPLGSCVE